MGALRPLKTPVPERATFGYGTNVVRVPGTRAVLFSWIEGRTHKLCLWDLPTGAFEVIDTPGLLRDALFDDRRAFVLTTGGLHEIDLSPLKTRSERVSDLPKWLSGMARIPGTNEALVWKRKAKTCLRVSLEGVGLTRVNRPAPALVTSDGRALSFERGVGYRADRPRETFEIPLGSAAIEVDGRVLYAPGKLGPARNVSPATQNDLVFDVHNDGTLAELDGKRVLDAGEPIVDLRGPTSDGRVLARVSDGFVEIALAKKKVVARHRVSGASCVIEDELVVLPQGTKVERAWVSSDTWSDATPTPPKKPRPRREPPAAGAIEGRVFERVDAVGELGPASFESCEFLHCRVGHAKKKTEVRGCSFVRCTFQGGYVFAGTRVVDCRFERIKIRGGTRFLNGLDLERVTLVGPIDGGLIVQHIPEAMRARIGEHDWALDLRRAELSALELRGVPSRLVRRDPETMVVVRRERALDRRWQALPIGAFSVSIGSMLREGDDDVVLIAGRRSRRFREELAALQLLRAEGIAE